MSSDIFSPPPCAPATPIDRQVIRSRRTGTSAPILSWHKAFRVSTCLAWGLPAFAMALPIALMAHPQVASAADLSSLAEVKSFSIAAQPLAQAIALFGRQSGVQVSAASAVVADATSTAVDGTMSAEQALQTLLIGTGVTYRLQGSTVLLLPVPTSDDENALQLSPVRVGASTGSGLGSLGQSTPVYAGGQVARASRLGALGNTDIMDAPFSATSYTAEAIANQQASTVGELLANDPTVRTSLGYGNMSEQFVIRGFPLYGDDLSVDGLFGMAPRQLAATEMYDRVEVLRGASAFLNGVAPGSSAIGGTINLVPKRATDTPITSITTSSTLSGEVGGHVDLGRRFGSHNQFGARMNLVRRDGDTSVDDEHRSTTLASLDLDYRGDRLRTSLDMGYQKIKIDQGRPGVFVSGTSVPDAPSSDTNYGAAWSYSTLQDTFSQTRVEYDLTDSIMAYGAFGLHHVEENGEYGTLTVGDDGSGTMSRMYVPREDNTETGQAGLRATTITGSVSHRLDGGISALHSTNHNSWTMSGTQDTSLYNPASLSYPATQWSGGDLSDLPLVSEITSKSAFASDTMGFFDDRVLLTLGARQQWLQVETFDRTTFQRTDNFNDQAFSPVIGVVVKPTEELSLYANRIEALQQGPTAPSGTTNEGQNFAPYKSTQYEIGGKLDFGKVGGSVSLFQTSEPTGITDPDTLTYSVSGKQKNQGIELTVFGQPLDDVKLLGGITFTRAKLHGTAGGTNDGNDAVGVPNYQANLSAEWQTPFLPSLTLSARVLYTAAQYVDEENTLKIPDWARLDIGARYQTEVSGTPITIRTNIENLTNESYWASASGGYLTQGNPLTAKLSVTADF